MRAAWDRIAARNRLLRLLVRGGARPAGALFALQALGAVLPALHALAVGYLVARPSPARACIVAGLLFLDQTGWLLRTALGTLVARRIDGSLRATVRSLAASAPGLGELESAEFQDRAERVIDGGVSMSRRRSAGAAAVGQLTLWFRMVGAAAATLLLARFSPVLAVSLLVVSLGVRTMLRRQWIGLIDVLDADPVSQRKLLYLSELAVTAASHDVRMYGLTDWLGMRFRAMGMIAYGKVWRGLWSVLRRQWLTFVLITAMAAAALAVPAMATADGRLRPDELITYVLAAWGIFAISGMGFEAYDIEYGLRGMQATEELTARYAGTAPGVEGPTATGGPPTVCLEDVVFTYPGRQRPTLDGLSLTLHPGEKLAVVGANGVGKTTFVKLLCGLYRPDSGRITVDGREPSLPEWRRRTTVLFQDFVRYPASLRDNVALGAPELPVNDDAVRKALDLAGAGALVDALPDGLDTSMWREGDDGTDVSGGQWQRIALARALYAVHAGRRLIVLDEPTAHLDARAEAEFHEQVVSRVPDVTTVLISHRLSTVRPADRIVLLRDGRVAESGSHSELLAAGGDYARFFALQAGAFHYRAESR
ncbi:ABC transporter ATP-binding protein [Micromonospora sp. NPDC049044]|uniref:ABC transporter ATP-binding protein n=1 Tax=unclassified Micromonospora TaxID=2617518 RepID=UPI0033C2AA16